jgi:hypothetical protein
MLKCPGLRFGIFIWIMFYQDLAIVADADCSCMNVFTNQTYPGSCCDLGSVTCDAAMKVQAICVKDGQTCPRMLYSKAKGHFISSSISWRATGENSVEFEIMSTWRLSFSWPYPLGTAYTGPCGYPGIGDTVPLVGISADPAATDPQQSATGTVSVQLQSGEKSFATSLACISACESECKVT